MHAHNTRQMHSNLKYLVKNSVKWWRIWERSDATLLYIYEVCSSIWLQHFKHSLIGLGQSIINTLSFNCVHKELLLNNQMSSILMYHCIFIGIQLPTAGGASCTIDGSKTRRVRVAVGGGGEEVRDTGGAKGGCFPARHWLISPVPKPQHLPTPNPSTYKQKACWQAHTHMHIPPPPCQWGTIKHTRKTVDCKYTNVQMWLCSKC